MRDAEQRLEQIEDPAERIRAVGDFFAGMDSELLRIAAVRYRAIVAMSDHGLSQGAIGKASGLVKQRIGQIMKDHRFHSGNLPQ